MSLLMLTMLVPLLRCILRFASQNRPRNRPNKPMSNLMSTIRTSRASRQRTHQSSLTFGALGALPLHAGCGVGVAGVAWIWVLVVGALLWELLHCATGVGGVVGGVVLALLVVLGLLSVLVLAVVGLLRWVLWLLVLVVAAVVVVLGWWLLGVLEAAWELLLAFVWRRKMWWVGE